MLLEIPMIHGKIFLHLFAMSMIAFMTTFALTPILASLARRFAIVDKPDNNLKKHEKVTPYLGGLAVYLGLMVALALLFPFQNSFFLFFVGSTILLCVGFIDDLFILSPQQKITGQIIATFCFLKAGFYLREQFFSSVFSSILSFFWILTITNAFNLIDVMDGLATTVAAMCTLSFLLCALALGEYTVALLLAAFLGALLAFLYFNKPQASIYLGDAGSLFIGGFLATVPFMLPWGTYNALGFLTPLIILAIPLLEITGLIIIRTYKKIPFYKGSPDHFCHYLKHKEWSTKRILWYVVLMSLVLLSTAYAFVINALSLQASLALGSLFLSCWVASLCPFSYFYVHKTTKV